MDYDPLALFGKRLIELRKRRNWSQERLALESGLARSYLGEVERGKRNIALINICVLAHTLGVPPSALLDFSTLATATKPAAETTPEGSRAAHSDRLM
jgi:transcriptional regulator with XRE-family HTH domain